MASGIINGSTNNEFIAAKIEWSSERDYDLNASMVTAALYYKRLNDYTTYGTGNFIIAFDTTTKRGGSKYVTITNDGWTLAAEATELIHHNSNGYGEVVLSATGGIPGTSFTSTTLSGTAILGTISRASTITSASNTTLGQSCSVKWTPLNKAFRYKLVFSLGDWSYTTSAIHPNQLTAYTHSVDIPMEVARQIPNAKKGTMTVALHTYSNSGATTQVGSASSKTFTVTVPNNNDTKPTGTMTIAAVNDLGDTFAGLYIQGRSQVQATITGTGKYGATIASREFIVEGKYYDSPFLSHYLPTAGTITVKGRVKDSRGYYTDIEREITVLPYSSPSVLPPSGASAVVCGRCYADGTLAEDGTYLRIQARRSYSPVTSGGEQNNFCTIRYRYRSERTNTYSAWVTLLEGTDTDADTVDSGAISTVVLSTETTYYVQVGVVDDMGGTDAVQFTVPTDFVTIDCPEEFNGRRIGIFRHVSGTTEDGLFVGLPIFGGSVDSLRLGTRLTATEAAPISLDDVLTPGCYYSPNAENSQYIANCPYTDGGFGLEVRELQHKDFIRQTLYFGRTTLWRHFNGTEFSDWVRVMVTTAFETACTDFVIETGTAEGWRYKKYKDGTYEMFGIFNVKATESTLNGSLYRTNNMTIPAPFTITSAFVSGTAVGFYWLTNAGKTASSSSITLRIMSDKTISTTAEIEVRLTVFGTYQ